MVEEFLAEAIGVPLGNILEDKLQQGLSFVSDQAKDVVASTAFNPPEGGIVQTLRDELSEVANEAFFRTPKRAETSSKRVRRDKLTRDSDSKKITNPRGSISYGTTQFQKTTYRKKKKKSHW